MDFILAANVKSCGAAPTFPTFTHRKAQNVALMQLQLVWPETVRANDVACLFADYIIGVVVHPENETSAPFGWPLFLACAVIRYSGKRYSPIVVAICQKTRLLHIANRDTRANGREFYIVQHYNTTTVV